MRECGMLLPVASLPSRYGIGAFSKEAYDFIDTLKAAGQSFWQILPLGPTGFGDSPYQSFSAFAGNPYFIDLDMLIEEGLLTKEFVDSKRWNIEDQYVDYGLVYNSRFEVLRVAYENSNHKELDEYKEFFTENEFWLEDYSLYRACKDKYEGRPWSEWDKEIKFREAETVGAFKEELKDDMDFYKFIQFKFNEQWCKLKEYANENGILIIGDIPIYVAMDSADVWQNTGMFQLDEELNPKKVAGVPPFSDLGQRWGNPLYDWDKMEADDFSWWRKRMEHSAKIYDVIRIDHFIGTVKYYAIPAEDSDARNGQWQKGPGLKLINAINESIGDKHIIAEDLGIKMPEVVEVLEKSGYPGMKVLEFAFDSRDTGSASDYLPHNYSVNSVAYTGTHDNETLVSWYQTITAAERAMVRDYLYDYATPEEQLYKSMIALVLRSAAATCIIPMQDWLGLDNSARINKPSTVGENWRWRLKKTQLTKKLQKEICRMTTRYGRMNWE